MTIQLKAIPAIIAHYRMHIQARFGSEWVSRSGPLSKCSSVVSFVSSCPHRGASSRKGTFETSPWKVNDDVGLGLRKTGTSPSFRMAYLRARNSLTSLMRRGSICLLEISCHLIPSIRMQPHRHEKTGAVRLFVRLGFGWGILPVGLSLPAKLIDSDL